MKARLPAGYGKQNMNDLMKKAQEMQDKMAEKTEELENTEYKVTAGGGMIELTMKGNYNVSAVKIKPEAVDPDDVELLEDMLGAAVNEAVRVVKESADKEMEQLSEQYNINVPGLSL